MVYSWPQKMRWTPWISSKSITIQFNPLSNQLQPSFNGASTVSGDSATTRLQRFSYIMAASPSKNLPHPAKHHNTRDRFTQTAHPVATTNQISTDSPDNTLRHHRISWISSQSWVTASMASSLQQTVPENKVSPENRAGASDGGGVGFAKVAAVSLAGTAGRADDDDDDWGCARNIT